VQSLVSQCFPSSRQGYRRLKQVSGRELQNLA
jgi:hypothetical protein